MPTPLARQQNQPPFRDADRDLIRSIAHRLAEARPTAPSSAPPIIAAIAMADGCVVVSDSEKDFEGGEIINPLRMAQ